MEGVGEAGRTEVPARVPNLFFSVQVANCVIEADLIFIAVNTPTKVTGAGAGIAMDMTAFDAAVAEIAHSARSETIIVEKSTVPCRTAQYVQERMAISRPNSHFEILSNPEFLAAGTAVQDLMHPDRVLIGSSPTPSGHRAAGLLADIYAAWVPRARILATNVWSSELSKLVANAMLAQRISSINSISAICEETGADIDEVAAAIGSDARIGDKFLKAGIGFGGSCIKKDVLSLVYLAVSLGLHDVGEYWRQVIMMNEHQRGRFSRRVVRCLDSTLVGKKITFLGVAFKANTSDMRESPMLDILKTLLEEQPREAAIFDPRCHPAVVRREIETFLDAQDAVRAIERLVVVYPNVYDACRGSHAILITTECDEFRTRPPNLPLPLPRCISSRRRDPKPLTGDVLTEMDVHALHMALLGSSPALERDPLQRLQMEPSCATDCVECMLIEAGGSSAGGHGGGESVDWCEISHHMESPKWVFDGKGVVDVEEMAKLGIRVERVGRQWGS